MIEVKNISKQYKIGQKQRYLSLRDSVTDFFRFGQKHTEGSDFWALDDVSFEVQAGESIGIIGRNGAGKSTLLKILSRITPPTKGKVILRGRIASLLEVGTGFHPELTGRENVFMNGSILGLRRAEITQKFDEIVAFSGVEQFIDTPLKHYSSGMQLRLAFAVAAHLEPEILVIDEVLAVGDAEFQKKCLGKMDEVSRSGRTIIFVSHDLVMLKKLCDRGILLEQGVIDFDSNMYSVISHYLRAQKDKTSVFTAVRKQNIPTIIRAEVKTSLFNNIHTFGQPLEIVFDIYTPNPILGACFSFQIVDNQEIAIVHGWAFDAPQHRFLADSGTYRLSFLIEAPKLFLGGYFLKCYLTEPPGGVVFDVLKNICPFRIEMYDVKKDYPFPWVEGNCRYIETYNWTVHKINEVI
ncbi:MAG: ATP-binding cassette domain-containing protein [Saprospiraceae bacterium]|nr:ATP-binding cassette domain-containing protein [Saprospiraceae bacterium]